MPWSSETYTRNASLAFCPYKMCVFLSSKIFCLNVCFVWSYCHFTQYLLDTVCMVLLQQVYPFHLLAFNKFVSLIVKCFSNSDYLDGPFFMHSANIFLSTGVFHPFTYNIIIVKRGFTSVIFLFGFCILSFYSFITAFLKINFLCTLLNLL